MELPIVKSCCALPLRKGCIILGICSSGYSLLMAIFHISYCIEKMQEWNYGNEESMILNAIIFSISFVMSAMLLAKFIVDLVFVVEVCGDTRAFVVSFYGFYRFWLLFLIFYIIAFLKIMIHLEPHRITVEVIFLGMHFYYLIVTLSYTRSLKEDEVNIRV